MGCQEANKILTGGLPSLIILYLLTTEMILSRFWKYQNYIKDAALDEIHITLNFVLKTLKSDSYAIPYVTNSSSKILYINNQ